MEVWSEKSGSHWPTQKKFLGWIIGLVQKNTTLWVMVKAYRNKVQILPAFSLPFVLSFGAVEGSIAEQSLGLCLPCMWILHPVVCLELAHCEGWLLSFQEFCKPVAIMLLAWNRIQWEYLNVEIDNYWKSGPHPTQSQLLNIYWHIVVHTDSHIFSIFLTTLIMDFILLQNIFNKWWKEPLD